MTTHEDVDTLKAKKICHRCVGEGYLKSEIKTKGASGTCSYCGRRGKTYTVETTAERVETAFEQHYRRTSDQPNSYEQSLLSDRESDYDWERHGEPVVYAIMNAANIPEEAARDIQTVLEDLHGDWESAKMGEETEFAGDSYYEERRISDHGWQEE